MIAFNARSGTIPLRCVFEWAPRRSAAVFGGSAESVLRSQEGSGTLGAYALRARGGFDRLQCSLRPGSAAASRRVSQRRLLLRAGVGPSRLHRRGHSVRPCLPFGGSAESVLRSQEGSGKEGLSRFARGMGLIAFNARSGPVPLPLRAGLRRRWRWFWGRLWKVGWIVDVRYGMKRTPNTGVVIRSHELGSESRNPTLRSAAFGSPPP